MDKKERLERSVHIQFESCSAWLRRHHLDPTDGMKEALSEEPENRPYYIEALRKRLGSSDLKQRTGSISVLEEIAKDIGADKALAALLSIPLVPDEFPAWSLGGDDLETVAVMKLASQVTASDHNTIAYLKHWVLQPKHKVHVLPALARVDPDWLLDNLSLVSHTSLVLLSALPEDRRFEFIDAMAPWPPEQKTMISDFFWSQLPPAEAQRLRSRIWPDEASSVQP